MKRYAVLALILSLAGCQITPYVRAAREFRTVNTSAYELSISKSGRMSLSLPSGAVVLTNAYPAMSAEQDERPKPINIPGVFSTRTMGKTKLGEGHGILLKKGDYRWLLQTYTTEPFLTVQVTYTNTSKKTVKVRMLSPLCAQLPLLLATNSAETQVQDTSNADVPIPDRYALVQDSQTGSFLLAAFLARNTSLTKVSVGHSQNTRRPVTEILAADVYDPPAEVPPGGSLTSDLLYLAVGENDPTEAALRFKAAAEKFYTDATR